MKIYRDWITLEVAIEISGEIPLPGTDEWSELGVQGDATAQAVVDLIEAAYKSGELEIPKGMRLVTYSVQKFEKYRTKGKKK